jgi:class 3 adenylate cyclase/tetratricopeptide (TPR) repeat protein
MQCSACGAELSPSTKFCLECGQPQHVTCPSCGAPLPTRAKFCGECGTAVDNGAATTPAPQSAPRATTPGPVAERRVCSVLFCDLVGFTPISESRDPEEVRELLSHYFDVARTVIGRYGGVVEKFIGDAVMAIWGAPIAVDGDAERAVRAALDVVDAVAELGRERGVEGLSARAGVVTGEVAVTIGATGQGMVAGDAVNTAARVQAAATPGSVLVDEGTWRVARGAVAFTDGGEHELKGKSEPARLWQADRVLSGVGGSQRVDGLEAPLVGRNAELRLVKELFHACVDRRSTRLISITGPAGVGKSRLGWEFFKYVDGLLDVVRWHRGRCLSYGDGVAFWALAEMVRQRFGIAEDDSSAVVAEKMAAGLQTWLPDDAVRDYVGPRVARLLGVEHETAELGRDELFAGWRVLVESIAKVEPVVLLVEDLQYADTGLLDFIDHLLDWARDVPILVITMSRPELADRRPGWGIGRRNGTALTLEPLDDDSMRAMLEGLVPGMPDAAAAAIAKQAQGIPLYAVETIRMLVDRDVVQPVDGVYRLVRDVGELAVPETLQSLLAARLDALEPDARRLVADAAVLGGSFPAEALVAVSGQPEDDVRRLLGELVRREVLAVRADPLSPDQGQYGFVQTMFRQVAYETLSRRERKSRHLAVAEHLTRMFADDGEEVSEVIAAHLLDALEAVPDDADVAELRDRAVRALVRAAERAQRTAGSGTAASAFARAAALEAQAGSSAANCSAAGLFERAASAVSDAGDQAAAAEFARQAVELYEREDDPRQAARARTTLGAALRRLGRLEEGRGHLREAFAALEAVTTEDTVVALDQLAIVELYAGNEESQLLAREALDRAQRLHLDDGAIAGLLISAGMCANWNNHRIEAIAFLREALRRAEAAESPRQVVGAALNLADILVAVDAAASVEIARAAVAHGRRVGNLFLLPTAISNLVQGLLLTGDWDAAMAECERDRDEWSLNEMTAYSIVLIQALRGEPEGLDEPLEVVRSHGESEDRQTLATVRLSEAMACRVRHDDASALAHASAALELANSIGCSHEMARWSWTVALDAAAGMRNVEAIERLISWADGHPDGHLSTVQLVERLRGRALLLALRGDAGADEAFSAAVGAARELRSPYHLALALMDQAEHRVSVGDETAAAPLAREVRPIAERLRCRPLLQRATAIAGAAEPVVDLAEVVAG